MVGQLGTGACLEPATLYPQHRRDARRSAAQPLRDAGHGRTSAGQARLRHRRRAGHRPRHGPGLRRRRGARGDRHRPATAPSSAGWRGCGSASRAGRARRRRAVAAAVERAGPLDVLFNCAGFVHQNTALDLHRRRTGTSPSRLNVRATWKGMPGRAAGDAGARAAASIVNVSSGAGCVKGAPNRFVYGATKAAVIGMTKSVGGGCVAKGVRCNAICPGTVDTPSLGRAHRRQRGRGGRARGGARRLRRAAGDGPPGHAPRRSPRWPSTSPRTRPPSSRARRW